jgi:hypothetical protein
MHVSVVRVTASMRHRIGHSAVVTLGTTQESVS